MPFPSIMILSCSFMAGTVNARAERSLSIAGANILAPAGHYNASTVPEYSNFSGTAVTINSSSEGLQPELKLPPLLPVNFSTDRSYWPHSTPLLGGGSGAYTSPHLARRQVNDSASSSSARYWTGWKNVEYLFAFGDSYTSTNFTVLGDLPSSENPLGNPPYPGITSSNGPNYIDFLTTTYNESFIQTINLAYGGATIDDALVPSRYGPAVQSFRQQVFSEFKNYYIENGNIRWDSSNSLFIIFFGINDVIDSFAEQNDSLNYELIKRYESIVDELYSYGARNFLFLNVPPVDRTPGSQILNAANRTAEAGYIGRFNFRLGALAWSLTRKHPDASVFQLDVNYLFAKVIDDPTLFPETAGYRNTTNDCAAYSEWVFSDLMDEPNLQTELIDVSGTPTLTFFAPACGVPVDEYLWLNGLHPTYPMHNFIASQAVKLFEI